jgi:hypothetical protein
MAPNPCPPVIRVVVLISQLLFSQIIRELIYLFIYYKGTSSDIFKLPFSEKCRNNERTNHNPMVLSWKLQVI